MLQTFNASAIIDDLKDEARQILGSVLGTSALSSFSIGQLGLFPYYWQDSKNVTLFNSRTYDWINAALLAGADPKQQSGIFTNEFLSLVTKISYKYSSTDTATVNEARKNTANQATNLQNVWLNNVGAFPAGTGQPIDRILSEIQTKWAATGKTVTLMEMQNAPDLRALLPNTPPSGFPVFQELGNYLTALGGAIGLINDSTLSNGILQTIRNHLNSPSTDPGAVQVASTTPGGDPVPQPAYPMGADLATIQNELANTGSKVSVSMTVSRDTATEFSVKVNGKVGITVPVLDFLSFSIGNESSYFENEIATTSNSTTVDMTFPGVCYVPFGPKNMSLSTPRAGWFYMDPILQAVQNGDKDVTGYRFDVKPTIDLSANGGFGFIEGVAISAYPTITITVKSSNYEKIAQEVNTHTDFGVSFLGIPIGAQGSVSTYHSTAVTDSSEKSVTITMTPPAMENPVGLNDSTAWILGVVTNYPAA